MSIVDDIADMLARETVAAMAELDDDRFYDKVAKVVGDISPTVQEAYTLAIRARLAERRTLDFIKRTLDARRTGAEAPKAPRGPDAGH
ncbi:MAG: hypothetical protein ACT4OK_12005 [Gemmobacter sp.]